MIQVLVVTENTEVREGLRTVLSLGGKIEVADCAAGMTVDVILVDLDLPGQRGIAALKQATASGTARAVIALTAHDYPAARESALRAGADALIVKGMDIQAKVEEIFWRMA